LEKLSALPDTLCSEKCPTRVTGKGEKRGKKRKKKRKRKREMKKRKVASMT